LELFWSNFINQKSEEEFMIRKIMVISVAAIMIMSFARDLSTIKRERVAWKDLNDKTNMSSSKLPYSGTVSSTFDQSMNGYGWVLNTSRKAQINMDPVTGPMLGSIYRRLDTAAGSGGIGGMIGLWSTTFTGNASTIYGSSIYQGGATGLPGGRYPNANEFINGYFFATFNDYDNVVGTTAVPISQPMFTVCDATLGYDLVTWSEPKRVEATEGGAVVPMAWLGSGDVTFNPEDGYYYWTQVWGQTLNNLEDCVKSVVVGRSNDPTNLDSWVWTDYNDLTFDATDDTSGVTNIGDFYVAYCKDLYGNGTGYGIAVANTVDVDDYALNNAGEEVQQNGKISYMYTTNWGGDDSSGDWNQNWIHDTDNKLFQIEAKDLFDWYGETIVDRDSIGIDSLTSEIIWDTLEVIPMNDPSIQFNLSAVATENNVVHLTFKVWPASLEYPGGSYFTMTDNGFRGGLYHVKGQITDTGVIWSKANYISSWVDNDTGEYDAKYYNSVNMTIGYAGRVNGFDVLYTSWLDKPTSRAILVPDKFTNCSADYVQDAFFSVSCDGGNSWEIPTVKPVDSGDPENPIWNLYYGTNITKTGTLHEQGWALVNHASVVGDQLTAYAVHQYYDPNVLTVADDYDYACYNQNLKVWKITGTLGFVGIETEEVSMVKDFTLDQNYPNPFNPSTEIRFALQNDSQVKLSVFNTKGELVANLKNEKMAKGAHAVNFDATALNSGVYFYKLNVNGMTETKKMVLTK
jgi:hypothetical protein